MPKLISILVIHLTQRGRLAARQDSKPKRLQRLPSNARFDLPKTMFGKQTQTVSDTLLLHPCFS